MKQIVVSFLICISLAFSVLSCKAANIVYNKSNDTAYLKGYLEFSDYIKLYKVYKENNFSTLVLNSDGGAVNDSIRMALFVNEHKIKTRVDNNTECVSACAFIWIAGSEKIIDGDKAIIGFHAPYYILPDGREYIADDSLVQLSWFFGKLGFRQRMAYDIQKVPPQSFIILDDRIAKIWGIEVKKATNNKKERVLHE